MLSPIILFTYNRPNHTSEVLNALSKNKEAADSLLYVFCDSAKLDATAIEIKNIQDTINVIKKESRFKDVIITIQKENQGLAKSIINGVTEIINKHGKVIVLEDDIQVGPTFLSYMNDALNYFESKKEVFHINGFNNESDLQFLLKDCYFSKFMSCWGWATWKDRWSQLNVDYNFHYDRLIENPNLLSKFNYENTLKHHTQLKGNIENKINTWAILWYSTVFFNNGLCLTPKFSLVENIGFDGSGEHCDATPLHKKKYHNQQVNLKQHFKNLTYEESYFARLHLKLFFLYGKNASLWYVLKSKLINKLRIIKHKLFNVFGADTDYLKEGVQLNKQWYGNEYGGFYVYPNILRKSSIVYSFGIGEDISFDAEIINKHQVQVFAFDPTPKSINWIKSNSLPSGFSFYEFGIDAVDGQKTFHLPANENHVSGSIYNPAHVSETKKVDVEMKSISTIMQQLGHKQINVLKMDIEGSEYEVLVDIIKRKVNVGQILVEFHDRFFDGKEPKSKQMVKELKKNGYVIFGVSKSKEEISFINKRLL